MPAALVTALTFVVLAALLLLWLKRTVLGRGFSVPLRTFFRKPETSEYPEQRYPPAPRFHGRHQLNRYSDGLEKCIGCELCAWACPADAIYVQGADNTEEQRFSPGERYAEDYQINYNRCIFCGLCIEACPTRALTMTHDYEFSDDTREGLIWDKDQLLAPLPDGARDTPHSTDDVRRRGINYYGGLATTPPTLHGGDFDQAAPAPAARAGEVIPTGELPSTGQVPDDPATVGRVAPGSSRGAGGVDRRRGAGGPSATDER